MMIKNAEIVFWWGSMRAKRTDFGGVLRSKQLFSQSVPTNPTKVAKKVYVGVLQHPTKFQAKILTGTFYLWRK